MEINIIRKLLIGLALITIILSEKFTWTESVSKCILANKVETNEMNTFPSSWIGGYYPTTQWVAYEGCRYPLEQLTGHQIMDKSPVTCLFICSGFKYFAIQNTTCYCLMDQMRLLQTKPSGCKLRCSGFTCSFNFKENSDTALFSNIENNLKDFQFPRNANNQHLLCTVMKIKKNKHGISTEIEATNCEQKNHISCRTNDKTEAVVIENTEDYEKATQKCDITTLKHFENILYDNLTANNSYWTNIRRFYMIKLVDKSTNISELVGQINKLKSLHCMSAHKTSVKQAVVVPLPCDNRLPFLCSSLETNVTDNNLGWNTNVPNATAENIITAESVDINMETHTIVLQPTPSISRTNDISMSHEVFSLHLVFVVCLSIVVVFVAVLSWWRRQRNRKQCTLITINVDENVDDIKNAEPEPLGQFLDAWDIQRGLKTDGNSFQPFNKTASSSSETYVRKAAESNEVEVSKAVELNGLYHSPSDGEMSKFRKIVSDVSRSAIKRATIFQNSIFKRRPHAQSPSYDVSYTDVELKNENVLYSRPTASSSSAADITTHNVNYTSISNSEYGVSNAVELNALDVSKAVESNEVYHSPWDGETSKLRKIVFDVSHSVIRRATIFQNSIFKRLSHAHPQVPSSDVA